MSSIDQRVVEMQFDNEAFGKGVKDSLKDLDNLKQGLKLDGATSGLSKVSEAANNFSMGNVESALSNISSKFSALGAIGFTVLSNLTTDAMNFGKSMISSVLDPLIQGGENRAHNIEQAKFQFEGLGMDVQAMMNSALDAVKGTAFGLDAAAKTAAQFGASGIQAGDQMTGALRGVAGLAAMTGSSFEDVGGIFTTVAGNGKLMSEQLYQFSSRGINVAAALAKQMGKSETQVRDMISNGKIDFKTFAAAMDEAFGAHAKDANKTYSGSLDNLHAALSRIGADFATPKFAGLRDIFNALSPAIDKVHTALKPVIDLYAKMQANSSASIVKFINGINFDGLTKAMPFVADSIDHIFTLLQQFVNVFKGAWQAIFPPASADIIVTIAAAVENFTKHILLTAGTMDNLKRTFAAVFAVVDILWQVLKGVGLFLVTLFKHFSTGSLHITTFTAKVGDVVVGFDKLLKQGDYINKFFAKLAIFVEKPIDFIKKLVGNIVSFVKAIMSSASAASIIGKIRDALSGLGGSGDHVGGVMEKLKKIFEVLGTVAMKVIDGIVKVLKKVGGAIGDFLKGLSFGDVVKAAGLTAIIAMALKIHKTFLKITVFLAKFKHTGTFMQNSITRPMEKLTGTLVQMTKMLKATMLLEIAAAILILTFAISKLSNIEPGKLLKATTAIGVMMGQLIGAVTIMDRVMKRGGTGKMIAMGIAMAALGIAVNLLASAAVKLGNLSWNELAKGLLGVGFLLGAIAVAMKFMPSQKKMISNGIGILIIASAIKVLVSAAKDMASMSWAEIAKGLTGVAALLTSLALFTKFSKMSSVGDGLGILLISAAVKVLASAMKDVAQLSWNEIAKGLTGVAGGLIAMAAAMKLMPDSSVFKGLGLIEVAAAMKILASAMTDMADLSWNEIAKGLTGVGVGVAAMAAALKLMPAKSAISGLGLVEAAASVKILASAVKDMAGLSWNDLSKGLVGVGVGIGAMAAALKLMPPSSAISGLGLLAASAAINILSGALQDMGSMSWSDIAAALVELAGALTILGVALTAMDGSIPGSLALLAAAPGLAALASAMGSLGGMSWSDIGAGLVALAGSLVILAVGLTAMSDPMILIGALALLAATPGISALATAMQAMGGMSWADIGAGLVALTGGLLALAVGLTAMIIALPGAAALALAAPGLGDLASAMQKAGSMSWSDIAAGVVAIGGALVALAIGLTAMIAALPGAAALAVAAPALGDLASAMKKIGAMSWSDIAAAAGGIASFLVALAVGSTTSIAIAALGGALAILSPNLKSFISAIKDAGSTGDNAKAIASGLKELAKVDADSLNKIASAADKLAKALPTLTSAVSTGLGASAADVVKAGAELSNNFAKGITDNTAPATDAGKTLVGKVQDAINQAVPGVASSVNSNAQSIGKNIVDGVNKGVDNNKASLTTKMQKMATDALNAAKAALGIHSPSKKFQEIGQYVVEGFAIGLAGHPEKVETAVDGLVNSLMGKFDDAMQSNLDDISKHQDKIGDLQGQIQDNAENIAAAQADLNDAINTPITYSKAKKASDRRAADAKANTARNNKIRDAQKKLSDLIEKQNAYNQAIADEQAGINQDSDEYWKLNAARATLANQLADEQVKLNELTDARDANNQAIDDEQKVLDAATQARDDYNQSLRDQYGAQEDISKETKVSDYVKDLQDQIVATQQFTIAIQELRKRGLNDELYKALLAKGPTDAMPFVQQLLDGTQESLDDINNLGKSLDEAAGVLGDDASASLYQAGVDAANGILLGLQSKATDIQNQMDAIAQYMVTALNNALGIHSPSRVMAEIGAYAALGLAKGLKDTAPMIEQASVIAGQSAMDSMKKTISGLGAMVSESMDVNPTISPVLDLSGVKKDASLIGAMLSAPAMSVSSAYSQANDAAAGYLANQLAAAGASSDSGNAPSSVTLIQNNNSPKALSSADIYRQTNNQLSVAKGALASNARKS